MLLLLRVCILGEIIGYWGWKVNVIYSQVNHFKSLTCSLDPSHIQQPAKNLHLHDEVSFPVAWVTHSHSLRSHPKWTSSQNAILVSKLASYSSGFIVISSLTSVSSVSLNKRVK